MNDTALSAAVRSHLTEVHDSLSTVHLDIPASEIVARARKRRVRRRQSALAGAAGIAACAALAVAALLPGSGTDSSTGQARLAAWTVAKQPDGSVMITLHAVRHPARLQQTLRADGIPAKVSVNRQEVENSLDVPGCHVYPLGPPDGAAGGTPEALWEKVFYGPHMNVRSDTFWVYPSAIPHERGVVIVIHYGPDKLSNDYRNYPVGTDLGYGVDSYSLYLVNATPKCTGS
jgi:hypothetical protein